MPIQLFGEGLNYFPKCIHYFPEKKHLFCRIGGDAGEDFQKIDPFLITPLSNETDYFPMVSVLQSKKINIFDNEFS
jgi:hypothetical protein